MNSFQISFGIKDINIISDRFWKLEQESLLKALLHCDAADLYNTLFLYHSIQKCRDK